MDYDILKNNKNSCNCWREFKSLLFVPMQICIFLQKRLVRELEEPDLSEFFTQKYLHIQGDPIKCPEF